MGKFKEFQFLIEKRRGIELLNNGNFPIKTFDVKDKKGYDYDNQGKGNSHTFDDNVLSWLGYDIESKQKKIMSKIISLLSKLKYIDTEDTYQIKYLLRVNLIENLDKILAGRHSRFSDVISNEDKFIEYYSIKENYTKIVKVLKIITKIQNEYNNLTLNMIKKVVTDYGIDWDDILKGFKWIDHFRSMSGKKIPKEVYPFLKAFTVTKIPKTIYRGIFIDGDVLDKSQKYEKGATIKLKNRKGTSWSTSIGVAIEFSTAQDMINNEKDGYQIVFKVDNPPKDSIIADFRGLKNLPYFNQQEILVDTSIKTAEIVYIKKGDEYKTSLRKNIKTKEGDGAYSMTFKKYLSAGNNFANFNLDINNKILVKQYMDLPFGEFIKKFPEVNPYIRYDIDKVKKVKTALMLPIFNKNNISVINVINDKKVEVSDMINIFPTDVDDIIESITGTKYNYFNNPIIIALKYDISMKNIYSNTYIISDITIDVSKRKNDKNITDLMIDEISKRIKKEINIKTLSSFSSDDNIKVKIV